MTYTYSIYPSIGVARVGNSIHLLGPTKEVNFYLAPNEIGGLPIDCDRNGNELYHPFITFKDQVGMVKRQAQKFRVYRKYQQGKEEEVTLRTEGVESIKWTVHLANKKASWYQYSEYKGNLLFGEKNSYKAQEVPKRNKDSNEERQKLIIDPGPRTIWGRNKSEEIDRNSIPKDYNKGSFPPDRVTFGYPINSLGTLKTDNEGRLLVLGGYGKSGGDKELSSYGGADTWYDDISDGSVTCEITFNNGETHQLEAWVIVGPPKFAPELVNISTWDDTMFDVGVRNFHFVPDMYNYDTKQWNDNFKANYQRDILPIIQRISGYHWVANVQSMIAFSSNIFDFSDPSKENKPNRQKYFSYFRKPEPPDHSKFPDSRQTTLFSGEKVPPEPPYVPMMPLNSGSNSVSNYNIEKFLALTETQYFLLQQWAEGKFENNPASAYEKVDKRNRASIGNVVGLPQSPGIEVTWTTQNSKIYAKPYEIKQREGYDYQKEGLSPDRDECEAGDGCEPGDLTKRMAIPWQADFFNCSIQNINFTDPNVNKDDQKVPVPPTYYAYWWPPQAPWDVLGGDLTVHAQNISHIPAGLQVNYIRGVNSYQQMVNKGWSYLGFIRNQNTEQDYGQKFPYMVETERDHDMFDYKAVPVSEISGNPDDKGTDIPVFYLKTVPKQQSELNRRLENLKKEVNNEILKKIEDEEKIFKEIKVVEEERQIPRSGTRVRF